MKFSKLRKKLEEWNIHWDARQGKGSHGGFVGRSHVTSIRRVFILPHKQQTDVSKSYIKPLRRQFELTPDDGISDEEFYG